jgi:ribosomal protein S18 acetylase RimI-like enzyme
MTDQEVVVRPMQSSDLAAVAAIDRAITAQDRTSYYERKFRLLEDPDVVNTCLVAEAGGQVVGFVMGDIFTGEYGIPDKSAVIDTIGIHPDYQDRGVASALFAQFRSNVKALKVKTTYVLIEWGDWEMAKFFEKEGFVPSSRVSLELPL